MTFNEVLSLKLAERKKQNRSRTRLVLESPQSTQVRIAGKNLLSFCSNDYLGLANHPLVIEAFIAAAKKYGVGSGASHLVTGHSQEHHLLEQELADFCGREKALLFSSGYMANIGVINTLVGRKDTVFEDKLNHASLLDGGLLAAAEFCRFKHNDYDDLTAKIKTSRGQLKLIAVDGVFSMDGDVADLPKLSEIAQSHDAWLMVDDAHGFGCLGTSGGGCTEYFGLSQYQVPVLVGTLGKAFGTFGAFVAGSELLIESLIQFARSYIYTTAIPPAVAAATRVSLQILKTEHWRREKLNNLITRFRAGCQHMGLHLSQSFSPIQPIFFGDDSSALSASAMLKEQGILITAIRPPTVPVGTSRLRVTLSAAHAESEIDRLLESISHLTSI